MTMKKIFPLFALALMSASANAQTLTAQSTVVDMGQVQYFTPTSGVFSLKNTSNKTVTIAEVDTGCGCTTVSYPTTPIPAGGEFTIKVTYDARMMGHFDKAIDVYAEGAKKPLQLDLRGVVVEEVTDFKGDFPFQLGSLTADCNYLEFEDVRLGEVLQQRFHIYNPTSKPVQPTIMHLPNYLKADISPSTVAPNRSAEVSITLDSRFIRDYGLAQTQIYLGATPGEKVARNKEIGVSVVLLPAAKDMTIAEKEMAPKLQMSATSLSLPMKDGKKKSAVIDIQNVGKSRLEIQKIEMFTTGLQVQLNKSSLMAGEMAKLKISTDPKLLKNLKTKPRVLIITNDPDQPKVIVDVDIE